jgi:hypothetical protein
MDGGMLVLWAFICGSRLESRMGGTLFLRIDDDSAKQDREGIWMGLDGFGRMLNEDLINEALEVHRQG